MKSSAKSRTEMKAIRRVLVARLELGAKGRGQGLCAFATRRPEVGLRGGLLVRQKPAGLICSPREGSPTPPSGELRGGLGTAG